MKIVDVIKYSGRSLKVQKGRAVLTVLGVVIGITAIVALNSLVGGFSNIITGQLSQGLSAQTLTVTSGSGGFGGFGGGGGRGAAATISYSNLTGSTDLQSYLKKNGNHVDGVMGVVTISAGQFAQTPSYYSTLNGSSVKYTATITGVDFATYGNSVFYASTFTTTGGLGSIPTDKNSIVIGYSAYHPYDNASTLINYGQNLVLNWRWLNTTAGNCSVNVTGVLAKIQGVSLASLTGGPSNNGIYMPITLAMKIFDTQKLSSIVLHVNSTDQSVIDNVTATTQAYFHSSGTVSVTSATSLLTTLNTVLGTVSALLTAIAAISLIVAGVNIVNIMTVSIIERTREIGILKAIGAKDADILGIFLVEALLIGIIGSLVGIGLGYLGSFGLGSILFRAATGAGGGFGGGFGGGLSTFVPVLSSTLFLEALGFGVGTAVIFALYPAFKASRKPPVEALRYE